MQRMPRLRKELERFSQQPMPGISCWPIDSNIFHLEANIMGPDNTPYENGLYQLDILIPERYPFEPPKLRFVTPVYHPNIDSSGRICLDVLKMPPSGSWKPSLNLSTLLTSVQLLMSDPNPDDPLMCDIAEEYKFNRVLYVQHAKEWAKLHAKPVNTNQFTSEQTSEVMKRLEVGGDEAHCKRRKFF